MVSNKNRVILSSSVKPNKVISKMNKVAEHIVLKTGFSNLCRQTLIVFDKAGNDDRHLSSTSAFKKKSQLLVDKDTTE
jgi:hypothetical protein